MVVTTTDDILVPSLGQREAARQIAAAYDWAECPDHFKATCPPSHTATTPTSKMKCWTGSIGTSNPRSRIDALVRSGGCR